VEAVTPAVPAPDLYLVVLHQDHIPVVVPGAVVLVEEAQGVVEETDNYQCRVFQSKVSQNNEKVD